MAKTAKVPAAKPAAKAKVIELPPHQGKWGTLPPTRVGFVFKDEAAVTNRDAWNWAALDPRNKKVVAEGHGFNSRAAATRAIKHEILGLVRITYSRHDAN